MTTTTIERFWAKVQKGTPEQCWLWTGQPNHKGYGRFGVDKQVILAHRFAWEITNGPIPDGLAACHKCDVPACVNPSHLFLGTIAENNADMRAKGRGHNPPAKVNKTSFKKGITTGENHPRAKLTISDVEEARCLRQSGWTYTQLSSRYGVSSTSIHKAVTGQSWSMVQGNEQHTEKRIADHHPNAKLTSQKVVEARALHAQGWSYAQLSSRYGVSTSSLHSAISGKTWRQLAC